MQRTFFSNQGGFTFIEALVAIVILGMAAIPILTLLGQSVDQLRRTAETTARAEAMISALAVIDPINPMDQASGEIEMTDFTLSWTSEEVVAPNDNVTIGAGLAGYSVGFYVVEVSLWQDGNPWHTFTVRKSGYRSIQSTSTPFSSGVR